MPELLDGRRDAIHVAQPVGDAGDAVQQEFRTGGAHGEDVVLDREALLAGHGVAGRPELTRPVLGHAAIEGGGGVGVNIDQPRRDERLAAIDQRVARPGQAAAAPMAEMVSPSMRMSAAGRNSSAPFTVRTAPPH